MYTYKYKHHYVYYSYEEWGRGYIGVRSTNVYPSEDKYMGSFRDKTFKPTQKIIIEEFSSRDEALDAEIKLHSLFCVDINPHFVNKRKQTSRKFDHAGRKNPMEGRTHTFETRLLISEKAKKRMSDPLHIKKLSKIQKELLWWNNGVTQTRSRQCPGTEFTRGQLPSNADNRRGEKHHMWGKRGNLAPCFGRTGTNHPMFGKNHSEETRKRMSLAHGKGVNSLAYGKRWWNNGKIRKFSKECPGPGWVLGMKIKRVV